MTHYHRMFQCVCRTSLLKKLEWVFSRRNLSEIIKFGHKDFYDEFKTLEDYVRRKMPG